MSGPLDNAAPLGGIVGILGSVAGVARWISKVSNKADAAMTAIAEIRSDLAEHDKRIKAVEQVPGQIDLLRETVRHQGELTASQLQTLSRQMIDHASTSKASQSDILRTLKDQDVAIADIRVKIAKL